MVEPLRGAGGEAYRAKDSRGRWVALRLPREAEGVEDDVLRKFCSEARQAGQLGKPTLLAVYEVGAYRERTFLVTELLEGKTLRDTMAAAPLLRKKALTLAVQIAQGLQAAHEKGLVHRDLRPETVFVTWDGRAKIMDFGFALLRNGTAAKDDPSEDVRAFGALLYEMVAGKKLAGPVKLDGDMAEPLTALIAKAQSKNPAERPTAAEMVSQLTPLLAIEDSGASGPGAYARLNALADVLGRPVGVGTARMALRDLTQEGMKPVKPPAEKSKAGLVVGVALAVIAVVVGLWLGLAR